MRTNNFMNELNIEYVNTTVMNYIKGIMDKIKSLKTEDESGCLVNQFYENICNDKYSLKSMREQAMTYKNRLEVNEFVSQIAMNEIYTNFIELMKENDFEDDIPLDYLNDILEDVQYFTDVNTKKWMKQFKHHVDLKLLGYRIEYNVDHYGEEQGWENVPHYIMTFEGPMKRYYEIEIYEDSYLDYYIMTYGKCEISRVRKPNITARVKERTPRMFTIAKFIEDEDILGMPYNKTLSMTYEEDIIELPEVFIVDSMGGDEYYPCGYISFNDKIFTKPNERQKDKRPVWIFKGGSGLGKSYLASLLSENKTVYETDSNEQLPSEIAADIIVLGNKYNFTLAEIKAKLVGDNEVIVVEFNN